MTIQTISEKILSAHCDRPVQAGEIAVCRVDCVIGTDGSGPMAIDYFEQMGGRSLFDPSRVFFSLDHYAPPGSRGLPALTRYINRCTAPGDRLVVLGYQPEIYFYADRRIGAGTVAFHANLGAAPEQQATIVSRLAQESVPVMILPVNDMREVEQSYPIVKRYIDERYELAQESGFGEGRLFRVLVDRRAAPAHVDEQLGLPCFRN